MSSRVDSVRRLMQSHRSRWQRLRLLEAIGWALSGICGYFLAVLLLDNVAHLPMVGRLLAAAGLVAVIVLLGGQLLRRWQQRNATEDEIALAIEGRTAGGVQNRLINTLQIGRLEGGENGAFSEALAQENCRDLEERALPGAMNARPVAVWLLLASALVAVGVIYWLRQPSQFSTSARRILLPFASIDPVYRTRLLVDPGDIEAAGDVTITVRIRGERPQELEVLLAEANRNRSHTVTVPPQGDVSYTVRNIDSSLSYAVRGGDFTSPYYRIETPTPARLSLVRTTYHYPTYTGIADKTVEHGGDLEGVAGTKADLVFVLDRPADKATLIVRGVKAVEPEGAGQGSADATNSTPTVRGAKTESTRELKSQGEKEFASELLLDEVSEYAIETQRAGRAPHRSPWHTVRVISDEPPRLELIGLPSTGEIAIDSALPLSVTASDDFGITRVGLFARRVANQAGAGASPEANASAAAANKAADGSPDSSGWVAIGDWPSKGVTKVEQACSLLPETVGAVEGERLEVVPRAIDNHPDRADRWTSGTPRVVMVVGDGAQLQILYEQILRTESDLATLTSAVQSLHAEADGWVKKLDAEPNAGGAAKLPDIVAAAAKMMTRQDQLRQSAGRTARDMVAQAGSLRLSLGMLSDTEMARSVRVLDSVATRDDAAGCRVALAEARATQHRTLQSLEQIQEQYQRFRQDWELAHMTPFLKMLSERQAALADGSRRQAASKTEATEAQRNTAARRQSKLGPLCGLAETAFAGLAERVAESETILSEVFSETATSLGADALTQLFKTAEDQLTAGAWADAAAAQQEAAERLDAIYTHLHEAQIEAAKRLLAAAEERADSDLAAQAELEKLKEGSAEDLLDEPDGLKLENIIHMAEVAKANGDGTGKDGEKYVNDYLFPDSAMSILQQPDSGKRQEFDILKLASAPGKTPSFPKQSDREGNRVKPHIQERFEDLVGDLLEEEDEMEANYESFNLNAAFNINEPGEIGKQGGDLNSTAAAAATGNQKPPTTNVGGASRVGRQGARAHGAAVGDESINRRGRDKVQEGQERSPDQAGSVKETKSDDPQEDTSTGIGGRKVESDESHFSVNDAGEWTDDMTERMDKPQEKHSIVERQGGKLSADVAELMRDRTSKQEQIIERLKTIRKELKNLYLPTDRLDELLDQLQAQTSSLKDRPTAEVYRLQQQTLAQVRGALQVFHQAHSGFQASLPRDQAVRGRVLDDPARTVPPGYETAVKNYYQRLSAP